MSPTLGFLVNTCNQFKEDNIDDIIDCFEETGVDKDQILIVSGQEKEFKEETYRSVRVINVVYTAINHTALVYLSTSSLLIKFDYWMILPETVRFGSNFTKLINFYLNTKILNLNLLPPVVPLLNITPEKNLPPSMDMGILKSDWIKYSLKDFCRHVHIFSHDMEEIKKLKEIMILTEDFVLASPISGKYRRRIYKTYPELWNAIRKTQNSHPFFYAQSIASMSNGLIQKRDEIKVDFVLKDNVMLQTENRQMLYSINDFQKQARTFNVF